MAVAVPDVCAEKFNHKYISIILDRDVHALPH